jgi:hypothetical protein
MGFFVAAQGYYSPKRIITPGKGSIILWIIPPNPQMGIILLSKWELGSRPPPPPPAGGGGGEGGGVWVFDNVI